MPLRFDRFLRTLARFLSPSPPQSPGTRAPGARGAKAPAPAGPSSPYPGDFDGTAAALYAPQPNGRPDPGEIVWTWVPYEEDYAQGKDRPVLLVGAARGRLLALMLTSRDHAGDRRGGDYLDLGAGPWDRSGRPSEVKLDRVLQIDPRDIRREGAVLDATRFKLVAAELRSRHGWS